MTNPALKMHAQYYSADDVLGGVSRVFNDCFGVSHRVALCGGADEPLYRPASGPGDVAQIIYREDFATSALHEIAHWCIAGASRRKLEDYGYWYGGDQRDADSQQVFEAAEVMPQALECLFSHACQIPFRVSPDNFTLRDYDAFGFRLSVWQRVRLLQKTGLNDRAVAFCAGLAQAFGTSGDYRNWTIPLDAIR